VDGQHNTLITTGNSIENDKAAEVAIKLFYGTSGVYELPTTVLAPGKQTWVDVGRLIRDQVPDRKGQLLPPGVMEGSYEIKDLTNHQVGYLYEGKLITDKTFGHATYGCALCCEYGGVGYDGFYLTPNPLYGTPGGGGQFNAWALNQCTGVDDPVDAYSYSSSNTSVATVTAVGHTSFVGAGTSTITGFAKLQSTQNPSCRPQPYQAPAPTTVQVPEHIVVLGDTQATQNCGAGPSTLARRITYVVDDTNGVRMQTPFLLKENVPTNIKRSCNNTTVQTGATCTPNLSYAPNLMGEFQDFLSLGCPSSQNVVPCGYQFANQQWQWCPGTGSPTSIGTVGPVNVQNTVINVDGNTLGFTPGTTFPK